jgi:hypothetical protein
MSSVALSADAKQRNTWGCCIDTDNFYSINHKTIQLQGVVAAFVIINIQPYQLLQAILTL